MSGSGRGWDFDRLREAAAAAPTDSSMPSFIGRYRILRELGRGGMGIVYEAEDSQLGRRVAVKVLGEVTQVRKTGAERFRREALAAARLDHPNVVRVFDAGEHEGRKYLVMELVVGRSLGELLRSRGPLPAVLSILAQAARGLAAAHAGGIIHRDIKPDNILVTEGREAKIGDFGLAYFLEDSGALTRTGSALGTPLYMAPEQVAGRPGDIRPATDVYALGAILYQILTGRPPHLGETAAEVFDRILREDPVPPRRISPRVSRDLETVCLKALDREPGRRYPSALEFAEDLERFLAGESVHASRLGAFTRAGRWVRRRSAVAGAVLAVAALAGVGVFWLAAHFRNRAKFEDSRRQAVQAHQAGEWSSALALCQSALTLREDPGLHRIADECRDRIARDLQERREAERRARLEERIRPLGEQVLETGMLFYVKGGDLGQRLRALIGSLEALEEEANGPDFEGFTDVWVVLGKGWYLVGDGRRAERAFRRLPRVEAESNGLVNHHLARIYLERVLGEPLSFDRPSNPQGIQSRSDWADLARECVRRPAQKWPKAVTDLDLHVAEGYRLMAEQQTQELRLHCDEGLRRFGDRMGSEEYWLLQGWIEKDHARSIECLDKALERRPHFPLASFMRGFQRMRTGRLAEAMQDVEDAIRDGPRRDGGHILRAVCCLTRADPVGATRALDEAILLDPDNITSRQIRSSARSTSGDLAGAIEDMNEAIRIHPNRPDLHYKRGRLLQQAKEYPRALKDFEHALDTSFPDWILRKDTLRRIEELRRIGPDPR